MKSILSLAIVLASTAAFAQTSSTTTSTTPAANTPSASATKAPASPTAVVGTSTASSEVKPVEAKKWSVALVSQASATNEAVQRIGESPVSTINYVGAGYKVTPDTKLGVRQYVAYNHTPGESNKGSLSWAAVTAGTKVSGLLGSEAIAPMFWYYVPTASTLKNILNTDETVAHNGILRMDAEIAWNLNPKWTVSYYLNPRQSIIANNVSYTDRKGKKTDLESTTTLLHFGYLYYNVSDAIQPYASIGMDHRATTADMRSIKDHAMLAVGANFTMLEGKFILNPEISNIVPLKTDGVYASAPRWLQSEDLAYELTAAVSF